MSRRSGAGGAVCVDEKVLPRRFARALLHAAYTDQVDLSLIGRNSSSPSSTNTSNGSTSWAGVSRGGARPATTALLDDAFQLYEIARFVEMPIVVQGCEDAIVEALSAETLPHVLRWAAAPHASQWVHRQAMRFLRDEFPSIMSVSACGRLPSSALAGALASPFLQASEACTLRALVRWAAERSPVVSRARRAAAADSVLRDALAALLPLVRLEHLPPDHDLLNQASHTHTHTHAHTRAAAADSVLRDALAALLPLVRLEHLPPDHDLLNQASHTHTHTRTHTRRRRGLGAARRARRAAAARAPRAPAARPRPAQPGESHTHTHTRTHTRRRRGLGAARRARRAAAARAPRAPAARPRPAQPGESHTHTHTHTHASHTHTHAHTRAAAADSVLRDALAALLPLVRLEHLPPDHDLLNQASHTHTHTHAHTRYDSADSVLRDALAALLPLVRLEHLPPDHDLLNQLIRRGVISGPVAGGGTADAWLGRGAFRPARCFLPYLDEIKALLEDQAVPEAEVSRVRRERYLHRIPDTLYMVAAARGVAAGVAAGAAGGAAGGAGAAPDAACVQPALLQAVRARVRELAHSQPQARALQLHAQHAQPVYRQIALRAVREMSLPDSCAELVLAEVHSEWEAPRPDRAEPGPEPDRAADCCRYTQAHSKADVHYLCFL
ncbi:BTB/POZ domain-containing protein 7 [Manduca sexta]|uniref:BTB/POZ domain-containing protein 7 n=1 Tax=Manduca sexta TaxID=7130 RepID=UPI00188FD235|nr:BTB/POZ domain-containing protein 7 [Manduca sexta]